MSDTHTIATAISNRLNVATGSGGLELGSIVSYRPRYTLQDLQTLRVAVRPGAETETVASRAKQEIKVEVDVAFQRQVLDLAEEVPVDGADVDAELATVASAKADLWANLRTIDLGGGRSAHLSETTTDPIVDDDKIAEEGVFVSVLTVSYTYWV